MIGCKDLVCGIINQLSFFGKLARRQPCCAFGFAAPGGLGRVASLLQKTGGCPYLSSGFGFEALWRKKTGGMFPGFLG